MVIARAGYSRGYAAPLSPFALLFPDRGIRQLDRHEIQLVPRRVARKRRDRAPKVEEERYASRATRRACGGWGRVIILISAGIETHRWRIPQR